MLKSNWTGIKKEIEFILKISIGPDLVSFIFLGVMPPEIMDEEKGQAKYRQMKRTHEQNSENGSIDCFETTFSKNAWRTTQFLTLHRRLYLWKLNFLQYMLLMFSKDILLYTRYSSKREFFQIILFSN